MKQYKIQNRNRKNSHSCVPLGYRRYRTPISNNRSLFYAQLVPLRYIIFQNVTHNIGCLKSYDTLTIYLVEALSCFQFVLSTILFFHHEPGSIVYWFWNAQPCALHTLIVALSESMASIFFQTWCPRITSQEKQGPGLRLGACYRLCQSKPR